MNFHLTEGQQNISKSAHAFADEFLDPIAAELDRSGVFPKVLIGQLAAQKFLGLLLPRESGGSAAGFVAYVEVVEALSRSCPTVASILNNHALPAYAISKWGSAEQKQKYLPALARGEILGGMAVCENGPTLGNGPDALIVSRQAGKTVLTGTKAFVRNAGVSSIYVVFGALAAADGKETIRAFLVEATAPGVSVGPSYDTMGLKGCPVADLIFSNVSIDDDAILGTEADEFSICSQLLALAAVAEAAQTVGIGQSAVVHAAAAAQKRVQFGHPVASLEAIQTLLAEIATDCHLGWLGVRHAAQLIEDGGSFEAPAAMIKSFLGRFGAKMLIDAIQIEGGLGISETVPRGVRGSTPLARMFRDIAGTTLLDAPADFPDKVIAGSIR